MPAESSAETDLVIIEAGRPGWSRSVTAQVAVLLPSVVFTVMVAVPAATAVTKPVALTVATAVLLDVQVTALLLALAGASVAVSC